MKGQIRAWSPRYTGKTPEETICNMEAEMRYPCREDLGEGCCYASTGCKHPSLVDPEYLPGELMTAPDRFVQGFMIGVVTVLAVGLVVFLYLNGVVG